VLQCPHKVELEQLRKELADLKSSIQRRPKINRARPINLIEINDSDTDVEQNADVEPNADVEANAN
jgi:AmiR/NasT family two-component response regulator